MASADKMLADLSLWINDTVRKAVADALEQLGEPETEHRYLTADGRETEFDLHNEGPCGCTRQSRQTWTGPWLNSGAHAAGIPGLDTGSGCVSLPNADTATRPNVTIELYRPAPGDFTTGLRKNIRLRPPGSGGRA